MIQILDEFLKVYPAYAQRSEAMEMKSHYLLTLSPKFSQLTLSFACNYINTNSTTPTPEIHHPIISVNREESGSESSPPSLSDHDTAPSTGSGGRLDDVEFRGENSVMELGEPFVLGFSSGDMTQSFPLQSSCSRNRSTSNNNTKEDRLKDELNLRGECAHLSEEAPTSLGDSADEWATLSSPRINESDDRSASLITTISPDPMDELYVNFVLPRGEYIKQFSLRVVAVKNQISTFLNQLNLR